LSYQASVAGPIYNRDVESLSSLSWLSDGKALLSGYFDSYEIRNGNNYSYGEVNNMTVVTSDMSRDIMIVEVRSSQWSPGLSKAVPRFNGGTLEPILRSFVTSDDKIIAVGNISTYAQAHYEESTVAENVYDYKTVASVIRM